MADYGLSPEMAASLRAADTCLSFDPSSIRDPAVAQMLGDIVNVLNMQLPRAIDQLLGGGAGGGGVAGAQCDEIWLRAIAKDGAVPAHLLAGMGNRAASALHVHINEFGGPGLPLPDSAVPGTAPSATAVLMLESMAFDPVKHGVTQRRRWIEQPVAGESTMLRRLRVTKAFYAAGGGLRIDGTLLTGPHLGDTVTANLWYVLGKDYPNCLINEDYPVWETVSVAGVTTYRCIGPYGTYGAPVGTIMLLDQSAFLPGGWEVVQVGAYLTLHKDADPTFVDGASGGQLTHNHLMQVGANVEAGNGYSSVVADSDTPTDLPPFSTYRLIRRIDNRG